MDGLGGLLTLGKGRLEAGAAEAERCSERETQPCLPTVLPAVLT